MTFVSLLRLLSVSVLFFPYMSHVYSFPSMYTLTRTSPGAPFRVRTDGSTPRSADRLFPLHMSSASLSKDYNSTYAELMQLRKQSNLLEQKWEKSFNLLCRYKEREGHTNPRYSHIENGLHLGEWLCRQRLLFRDGKLQAERQTRLESLGVIWDYRSYRWDEMFQLLCAFQEREGHTNVPQHHKEEDENLGTWLDRQRASYRAGKLKPERLSRLISIGVRWDADLVHLNELDMQWEKMFNLLCKFKEREGHTNVPTSYVDDGEKLGRWLAKQRSFERAGRLKPERKIKLDSLGVSYELLGHVRDDAGKYWQTMFDLLCTFQKREGHTNVVRSHEEDGMMLGEWLYRQRQLHAEWVLREERQSKLESVGVYFDGLIADAKRRDTEWQRMFDILCAFKEREGNVNVPRDHKEGCENLGSWLSRQRQYYREGFLQAERQKKLELVGVQFDGQKVQEQRWATQWEDMFDLLCMYKERVGHANAPVGHTEGGENLGWWLSTQRQMHKNGTLLPERKAKLESLGVHLKVQSTAAKWGEMFDLLCTYKEREGHANVPQRHKEEGQNLGSWLDYQRKSYKAGKLLPERQNKLESLGVQLQDQLTAKWEEMFDLLCKYKEREGNTNVPQKHKEEGQNLGHWLSRQRQSYKAGKLLLERQRKLESIGVQLKNR